MPAIICVNTKDGVAYNTEEDLAYVVYYVYDCTKTMEDTVRPGHAVGNFVGCYPFIGPQDLIYDEGEVSKYMILNNRIYGKSDGNLIRHWVISFAKDDYIMPQDAANLGNYLIHAIGENYISAFGVHLDKKCIHIHLIINCISWRDGKRYDVPYEYRWIRSMVDGWYRAHVENTLHDHRYEKYLFNE